jgi:hypothetical protein
VAEGMARSPRRTGQHQSNSIEFRCKVERLRYFYPILFKSRTQFEAAAGSR